MNQIVKGNDPISALQRILTANQHHIEAALPKHMRPERLIRLAVTSLKVTPRLQDCTMLSICNSVMLSAQIGLEFGNGLGHSYLIPYGNQCTLQIGYRGFLELAYRGNKDLRDARAILIYQNEPFDYVEGSTPRFSHSPIAPKDRGEWIGAYSRLTHTDNFQSCFFMWKEEIEEVRDKSSKAWKKDEKERSRLEDPKEKPDLKFAWSPWTVWPQEQQKKTVIKRHLKMERLGSELSWAVGLDDQAEGHAANDNKVARLHVVQDLALENGLVDQAIQADDELEWSHAAQNDVAQQKLTDAGHSDQWWASVKESTIKLIESKKFPQGLRPAFLAKIEACPYGNSILDLKLEVEDLIKAQKGA